MRATPNPPTLRLTGGAVKAALAAGLLVLFSAPPAQAQNQSAICGERAVSVATEALRAFRRAQEAAPAGDTARLRAAVEPLVARHVALGEVARRALGDDAWSELPEVDRGRMARAVGRYAATWAVRALGWGARDTAPEEIAPAPEMPTRYGGVLEVPLTVRAGGAENEVRVVMSLDPEMSCRLVDVKGAGYDIGETLRREVKKLLDDYSFPYMVAVIGDHDEVVLEDFEAGPVGGLPFGWSVRDQDREKNKPYRVKEENGNRYLEATDRGESVILGKKTPWNLDEYPYVSFRVRVWRVPEGGDERTNDRVDSAAGIYFTVKTKMFGKIPESVKYVWSSTLPVGTAVRRKGIGKPFPVVFGTDKVGLGEWRTYTFDLRQAYRDTFGGDPGSKAQGIGILSDANSLKAEAFADYDDIRALRTAPPGTGSGVTRVVPPIGNE